MNTKQKKIINFLFFLFVTLVGLGMFYFGANYHIVGCTSQLEFCIHPILWKVGGLIVMFIGILFISTRKYPDGDAK